MELEVKRRQDLSGLCRKLEQQLRSLARRADEAAASFAENYNTQLLLAEGVLLHKALYATVQPAQHQLILQPDSSTDDETLQSVLSGRLGNSSTATLLDLVGATTSLLQALMTATTVQVKVCARRLTRETSHITTATFQKLVLLMELLTPSRYPDLLITATPQQQLPQADQQQQSEQQLLHEQQQQQADEGSTATRSTDSSINRSTGHSDGQPHAREQTLQQDDLKAAAQQLLVHLQEFKSVMQVMVLEAAVLVVHAPARAFELTSMNLATGQPCTPPASHFLHAARRLRLTSQQVKHLQLILKQYNRMARQLHDSGMELVDQSAHSFSLQAETATLAASDQGAGASASALGAGATTGSAPASEFDAAGPSSRALLAAELQESRQCSAAAAQAAAEPQQQGEDSSCGNAGLEKLLQQHMSSTLNMHRMVSHWVINTLTPWQQAGFLVACYPYQPYMQVLAEVSPVLTPDDTPPVLIDAGCCEEAAQAAELADELGFTGAHAYMERRCAALAAQVEWALTEAQNIL